MTPQARVAAAITVLDRIIAGAAAEQALTGWARGARYAGSGDRAAVRDLVFDGLRGMRSLAGLGGAQTGRGLMIGLARRDGTDLTALFDGQGHAAAPLTPDELAWTPQPMTEAERNDLPDWLYPLFVAALGTEADRVLAAMQARAPMFLRVNLSRGTRAAAQASLAGDGIMTRPHDNVSTALEVVDNLRKVASAPAYITGLVEVQDAASQAAVLALPLVGGQRLLDYCAGGGGKALAICDRAKVDLWAHDIAPGRMVDLPARAARAGVRLSLVTNRDPGHHGPFDLVLCDAPCSGSGTWRRSPDSKWRLTPDQLANYLRTQSEILDKASSLVMQGGMLAYMTCSVLAAENNSQITGFLARSDGWQAVAEQTWLPGAEGDGFFLSVLRRSA